MKKTKNIVIRVAPETKTRIFQEAKAENLSVSQYILKRIDNTLPTHAESTSSCIVVNKVMNVLRNQTSIKKEVVENIEKELMTYVKC